MVLDRNHMKCMACGRWSTIELEGMPDKSGSPSSIRLCRRCADKMREMLDIMAETEGNGSGIPRTDPLESAAKGEAPDPDQVQKSMQRMLPSYTPQYIYSELCRKVVGQDKPKKLLSVALYNHLKRMSPGEHKLKKSSILLIGPSGCGKTLLAETAARMLDVPHATIDATSMSETGFKGDNASVAAERLMAAASWDKRKAEHGILFVDEIDKLARHGDEPGAVNAIAVQHALLKIIEGTDVTVKDKDGCQRTVNTSDVLVICGGAFTGLLEDRKDGEHRTAGFMADGGGRDKECSSELAGQSNRAITNQELERFGIIPELAGRLQIKAVLDPLDRTDLARILTQPDDSMASQYREALADDGVDLSFDEDALLAIADKALKEGSGARGLKAILDNLMLETMFAVPSHMRDAQDGCGGYRLTITADDVDGRTRPEWHIIKNDRTAEPDMEMEAGIQS